MTQALATVQYKPTEITTERLGQIMVKSGFFKDLREEAQAIVKILYGKELGFGPMASVLGVYIVEGRPSLSAQLIAAAVQRSDRYTYRVREWTPMICRIEFFGAIGQAGQGMESLGEASFSMPEAQAAGLAGKQVWKSYPKAMLWARAMSQGARAYCAEIFLGAIYTPEELGAEVDGEGVVIEALPGSRSFQALAAEDDGGLARAGAIAQEMLEHRFGTAVSFRCTECGIDIVAPGGQVINAQQADQIIARYGRLICKEHRPTKTATSA